MTTTKRSPRATIACLLMTKNEAWRVRRCLESVQWMDEIIVVDDESTDETVQVCREYGANVLTRKSAGNFDAQWAFAMAHATSEWVIQLDADEVIPSALRQEMERILADPNACDYYRARRKNFALGTHWLRYGGWYGPCGTKMWRRIKGRYMGRMVHVTIVVEGRRGDFREDIEHYPIPTYTFHLNKLHMYTTLEAREMFENYGTALLPQVRYQLSWRLLQLFWKCYVKKQGWRDGMPGLVMASLAVADHIMRWVKYDDLAREASEQSKTST